jgi:NAD(P)H-nitrite reductase large subunit
MPAATNARVTSIDALDDFRAKLLVYITRARRLLDDVNDDVVRTRAWLQSNRLPHWKKQVWLKQKELAAADQELMTARLSDMPEAVQARRMVVNKCKAALRETEERLERVKKWVKHYGSVVEPKAKVVIQMRQVVDHDLRKAVAFLENAASTLTDYAEIRKVGPPAADPAGDGPAASEKVGTAESNSKTP